jgi:hypothetical protein
MATGPSCDSTPSPYLPQDVTPVDAITQGMASALQRMLGSSPQSRLGLSHFEIEPAPDWVDGPDLMSGHALALTPVPDTTTAGTLPSSGVLLHRSHRYYDPLGLPLRSGRLHARLIRRTLPRQGPRRRASPVP